MFLQQRPDVAGEINACGSLGEGVPVPFPAFYSTDGGQNWARSTGSLSSHALDTAVEFDGSGRAIFSAIDLGRRDGTPAGIVVGISTDGGQTFAAMSHAMDTSTAFAFPDGSTRTLCARQSSFFDFPKLAADRSAVSPYRNNLYLIAQALSFDLDGDGSCETSPHVFIRSRDGGATWESGQVIPGMRQPTGSIGIGPDGAIYISDPTVNTPFCSTGSGIALRKSLDGGASFLPVTCALLSDTAFQPGLTWTAADASDPGKLYIAFSATVGVLGPSDHIYVIRSVDAGATWAPPVRVDDLLADDRVDHLRPSLAASGNGRVDVAWMDYRNSTPKQWARDRQPGDVYYSYSLDAGRTWAPNLRLSSSTSPLLSGAGNDYLTVVSSANTAHAIYAQDQNGNVLYEARLTTLIFH